jgi:hypothetical protein
MNNHWLESHFVKLINEESSRVRFYRNSFVVELEVPSVVAYELQSILSSNVNIFSKYLSIAASVSGYSVLPPTDCCAAVIETFVTETIMNEDFDYTHDAETSHQDACKTYCTLFETTEYAPDKGQSVSISIEQMIRFLKCNAWDKPNRRCMLLCLSKETEFFVESIYTDTKSYRNNPKHIWKKAILDRLQRSSLLNGLKTQESDFCTSVHSEEGYYFMLVTFDMDDVFQNKANFVVEQGLKSAKIQICCREHFFLESFDVLQRC